MKFGKKIEYVIIHGEIIEKYHDDKPYHPAALRRDCGARGGVGA